MLELILRDMTEKGLATYVTKQLSIFFPDGCTISKHVFEPYVFEALERTRLCFSGINRKKFRDGNQAIFNYLHPDHYAMFLYLLANTVSRRGDHNALAFRLFYLNKVLHGLDVYHDTELPEVFQFMHPVGTILGQAKYGNHFCVYQGCTIGSDENGNFPSIGECVLLYANASIIGNCKIGNNVVIGANTLLLGRNVPDDKTVFGGFQRLNIQANLKHVRDRRFQ